MEHYRDNLRHLVRPEDPSDRDPEDRVLLQDYEALFLANAFASHAAYDADTQLEEDLCLAYVEYINMVVREEKAGHVYLYAHTEKARDLLITVATNLDASETTTDGIGVMVEANLTKA